LNIALIGCGRISKNHFESIKKFPNDLNLVAVCDIVEKKAKKAGAEYGAKYYSNYEKMLEKEDIDIVSVCTPSGLHPKHGIMAAKKGINVVTEKPMGITLKSVDELIKTADNNKVKLFVVKQNRLNTTMQLLKRAILKIVLAGFIWFSQMYFGKDLKSITIWLIGVVLGNLTVVLL